jgi:hypothetical protein
LPFKAAANLGHIVGDCELEMGAFFAEQRAEDRGLPLPETDTQ